MADEAVTTSAGSEESASPGLRERKRAETIDAILEAAQLLFLARGGATDPELMTMARVAELAGVSERTMYRFFPSRADLDRAMVARDRERAGDMMRSDPSSWPDELRRMAREWSARNGDRPVERRDPTAHQYPASAAYRIERDATSLDVLGGRVTDDRVGPRQRLALTGVVQSLVSARALAVTAERWGLTLAEVGEAQAWAFEVLLRALADDPPEPWDLEP